MSGLTDAEQETVRRMHVHISARDLLEAVADIKADAYQQGRADARKDELVTCPECRSTFETEDGTVHEGRADLAARLEALADEWDGITGDNADAVQQWHDAANWLRDDLRAILAADSTPTEARP